MSNLIDLTGRKFGRLTVVERQPNQGRKTMWLCRCDCGNETVISGSNLTSGNTKSCGCYHTERLHQDTVKENRYNFTNEYGIGYTSKGEEFYFDLEDYDKIKDYCWYKTYYGYIATRERYSKKHIFLHRLVLNYNGDMDIDHIDGNQLNNCKNNLRICYHKDNMKNQKKRVTNKSGVIGVHWDKSRNKWCATLKIDGKDVLRKRFNTIEEASQARREAEEKYFGEFARKKLEDDEF